VGGEGFSFTGSDGTNGERKLFLDALLAVKEGVVGRLNKETKAVDRFISMGKQSVQKKTFKVFGGEYRRSD